jgi:transcriptional regulator with XRE-family HTH domain
MAITRASVSRDTARRMRRVHLTTGEDIRRMRLDAGLSLTALAGVVDIHRSHLARIEAGAARPSLEVLTAIGVSLGADLGIRYFPGAGPRLHDRFQVAMVETILKALDPRWQAELEVPVTQPARGVVDLVLVDRSSPSVVASEVQSELRRLEQQIRWTAEKADGLTERFRREGRLATSDSVSRLLILRSTLATRELARRYAMTLSAAYPARAADVVKALTTRSSPWPGAGIVWIRVDGPDCRLLDGPPRGVSVGR